MDLRQLPKAELHVHIEGTLEPEQLFVMAGRNNVTLDFPTVEELRAAYQFTDLQSFLDIYYQAADVLLTDEDFYDLTWAYLEKAAADGVRRAEIFFDPQAHTERGIPLETILSGIGAAVADAESIGVSGALIMCFLRHLGPEAALEALEAALPYKDRLLGIGLDSTEIGFPPEIFVETFDLARSEGLHVVAHAGEEGPPEFVWQALDVLGAERIDHGVRSLGDPRLVARLAADQIPLTVCPLSNVKLKGVGRIEDHPLKRMLDLGLKVSINSDDPAYFGGYIGDNYQAIQRGLQLTDDDMAKIAHNSIESTFLAAPAKQALFATWEQ